MIQYCDLKVLVWWHSYDVAPPTVDKTSQHHPSNDPRYETHEFPDEFTESLSTTLDRVLPYYEQNIVPEIKAGKNVVIAAHGNSLRALVKHLDNIDESTISELNIPTGIPLVYELDDDLKVIPSDKGMAPLTGRYLGELLFMTQSVEILFLLLRTYFLLHTFHFILHLTLHVLILFTKIFTLQEIKMPFEQGLRESRTRRNREKKD